MKAESGFGFWPTTWLLLNSLTSSNAEIIADDGRMILLPVIGVKCRSGSERVIGKKFLRLEFRQIYSPPGFPAIDVVDICGLVRAGLAGKFAARIRPGRWSLAPGIDSEPAGESPD